ncbi:hypothetical protein IHC87_06845 [Photobacterium damselae subsp. damselae]|uniref:hypothetical protein n=1 Tax=Photobacterium damselae TaxID=38293 RepID=UPI001F1759A9|nr:hypothetical protein [Photobacterium damselae]UJZ95057.1 hypothetical protein IHC87_06845 [Photobacterium damselae subsp. damselae]UJZ99038.1 hypothetical protein IHC88_06835 [Photobacterium damselae subsp. damselae]
MSVVFVLFLLSCGFIFTNMHLPARTRQKKSTGWDSYFHVAAWGFCFIFAGGFLYTCIFLALESIEFILNLPRYFVEYDKVDLTSFLSKTVFLNVRIDTVFVAVLSMFLSVLFGIASQRRMSDPHKRKKVIQKLVTSDSIEKMIFDSMDKKMLVLVSLSSRKVYVGMIESTRVERGDSENITIIPFISGYRDSDTLVFKVSHDYITHYLENEISASSVPLAISDFRIVLPVSNIESISLFDPDTYQNFESKTPPLLSSVA